MVAKLIEGTEVVEKPGIRGEIVDGPRLCIVEGFIENSNVIDSSLPLPLRVGLRICTDEEREAVPATRFFVKCWAVGIGGNENAIDIETGFRPAVCDGQNVMPLAIIHATAGDVAASTIVGNF